MTAHKYDAVLQVPQLLTVTATAQILGCSTRTVRRRIAVGALPAVLDHGTLKVRGDDLHTYIDQLERYGPTPGRRRPRSRHDFGFLSE